jgi:hypothetical protein
MLQKSRIKLEEIKNDIIDSLKENFSSIGKYFSSASPFGQIINVLTNIYQMVLFYIEDSITELNILTATRKKSIQGLASLVGHDVTRMISSEGSIYLKVKNSADVSNIPNSEIILSNFTRIINNKTNITYTIMLNSDILKLKILPNKSYIFKIIQGEFEFQKFTSDGKSLQSFSVLSRGRDIENFNVSVFVNNEKWKIYKSLYDMSMNTKGCVVKTSVTGGGIDVFFGNGYFGKIPEEGSEIKVEYLVTDGAFGNIPVISSLVGFSFKDVGYNILGDEIDLNEYFEIGLSTPVLFGSDGESIEFTRIIAPKSSKNFVLITPESYKNFLEKFNYFQVIDAFTTLNDNNVSDDNTVYLFLIPDITKRILTPLDYYNLPEGVFIINDVEKNKIYDLLEKGGYQSITRDVVILTPVVKRYVLNVVISVFKDSDVNFIKDKIVLEIGNYFLMNKRRDKIPRSDIISLVENVPGVDSVFCWFLSEENEKDKILNPDSKDLIGLDEFGDIVIGKNEIAVLRGGWKDRGGIFYENSINHNKPSIVNIIVKK